LRYHKSYFEQLSAIFLTGSLLFFASLSEFCVPIVQPGRLFCRRERKDDAAREQHPGVLGGLPPHDGEAADDGHRRRRHPACP